MGVENLTPDEQKELAQLQLDLAPPPLAKKGTLTPSEQQELANLHQEFGGKPSGDGAPATNFLKRAGLQLLGPLGSIDQNYQDVKSMFQAISKGENPGEVAGAPVDLSRLPGAVGTTGDAFLKSSLPFVYDRAQALVRSGITSDSYSQSLQKVQEGQAARNREYPANATLGSVLGFVNPVGIPSQVAKGVGKIVQLPGAVGSYLNPGLQGGATSGILSFLENPDISVSELLKSAGRGSLFNTGVASAQVLGNKIAPRLVSSTIKPSAEQVKRGLPERALEENLITPGSLQKNLELAQGRQAGLTPQLNSTVQNIPGLMDLNTLGDTPKIQKIIADLKLGGESTASSNLENLLNEVRANGAVSPEQALKIKQALGSAGYLNSGVPGGGPRADIQRALSQEIDTRLATADPTGQFKPIESKIATAIEMQRALNKTMVNKGRNNVFGLPELLVGASGGAGGLLSGHPLQGVVSGLGAAAAYKILGSPTVKLGLAKVLHNLPASAPKTENLLEYLKQLYSAPSANQP